MSSAFATFGASLAGASALTRPRRARASRRAPTRAPLRVSACGACTRRELFAGVLSSTMARKDGAGAEPLGSRAREAYDANFARTMEGGMADYETKMRAVKDELFSKVVGEDILEIGMGTGPNMRYYEGLRVVGVEPNAQSFEYAAANAKKYRLKSFDLVEGVGERLPVPDASVDTVVATLVNCTVDDVAAVAREVRRALRPGGVYLFLDHVAAPDGTPLRALQTVFDPLNRAAYEGCRLTRDPMEHILGAGFAEVEYKRFIAGAAADSWLTAPSAGEALRRARDAASPLDAVEPHFLLSPHVVGVARA